MTTRVVALVPNEFYHVYNRGTDKRIIYSDSFDYIRFVELLYVANSGYSVNVRDIKNRHKTVFDFDRGEPLVALGAYCLMPNHFHVLVTPLVENGISIFMAKLATSYSMYFNKRYKRTGALFEGAFKSEHASHDEYLKYLFAYIHLNPVKLIDSTWKEQGIQDSTKAYNYAAAYAYSSLQDYLGVGRAEGAILNKDLFPAYFPTQTDLKQELSEWLTYQEKS